VAHEDREKRTLACAISASDNGQLRVKFNLYVIELSPSFDMQRFEDDSLAHQNIVSDDLEVAIGLSQVIGSTLFSTGQIDMQKYLV